MATQTAHAEADDGRETDRLEEEGQVEHGNTRVFALRDSRRDEDDAHGHVDAKHNARAEPVHQEDADKAAHGERRLGAGEQLRADGGRGVGAGFSRVVNEEPSRV